MELPVGPLVDSRAAPRPERVTLAGHSVSLEPLDAERHSIGLWEAASGDANNGLWRYLPYGPFRNYEEFCRHLEEQTISADPLFFGILDRRSGDARGHAALMRIAPADRCIEVGNVLFTAPLQHTPAATESMYLLARYVFDDLGYRRYEWKCDALNGPSKRAALRLGFQFEGIFRQHKIVKGRNRDTAWFSMLDSEWPRRKANFERWLDPANFDTSGKQLSSLSDLNGIANE